jgi:hypothetical protein
VVYWLVPVALYNARDGSEFPKQEFCLRGGVEKGLARGGEE